jgi:hypothetical protein
LAILSDQSGPFEEIEAGMGGRAETEDSTGAREGDGEESGWKREAKGFKPRGGSNCIASPAAQLAPDGVDSLEPLDGES